MQGWNINNDTGLENLAQATLDAEFGLSFYDPYVSEPSLDLSPYLEDIDLDTSQQADIFDLVSTMAPKQDVKAIQHHGYGAFENEFEQFLDESSGFMAEYNEAEAFGSQTVPLFTETDWQSSSSDSSPSPSPELPSDARKLKSRRQRGRRSSANKSNQSGDKNTYEYRLKRERNNVAVRKSRMKTKEKQVAIFRKASELSEENEDLQSVVASLTEELQRLKSYLANSGISHLDLPIEA
jgi:uncharacterized phage infection (PIP) family protein YhgE